MDIDGDLLDVLPFVQKMYLTLNGAHNLRMSRKKKEEYSVRVEQRNGG